MYGSCDFAGNNRFSDTVSRARASRPDLSSRIPDQSGRTNGGTPDNPSREQEEHMPALKGSKTEKNLKEAFAGESQANRRYLYFARKADVEGYPDVAGVFRDTAEGETGHAFGHFDFLKEVGDPATGEPVGDTSTNLKSAVAGETYEYTQMYPGFAKIAREEGFSEISEWFETLAKAEKSHAGRFTQALKNLQ
jgi:rubrerythrin